MLMTKGLVKEREMTLMRRGGLEFKIFIFFILSLINCYILSFIFK